MPFVGRKLGRRLFGFVVVVDVVVVGASIKPAVPEEAAAAAATSLLTRADDDEEVRLSWEADTSVEEDDCGWVDCCCRSLRRSFSWKLWEEEEEGGGGCVEGGCCWGCSCFFDELYDYREKGGTCVLKESLRLVFTFTNEK